MTVIVSPSIFPSSEQIHPPYPWILDEFTNTLQHLWTVLFEPLLYIKIMLFVMLLMDELNRKVSTSVPSNVISTIIFRVFIIQCSCGRRDYLFAWHYSKIGAFCGTKRNRPSFTGLDSLKLITKRICPNLDVLLCHALVPQTLKFPMQVARGAFLGAALVLLGSPSQGHFAGVWAVQGSEDRA